MFSNHSKARSAETGYRDELLQLGALVHLHHDIAAPNELPVDVQLRDRRPLGVQRRQATRPDTKRGGKMGTGDKPVEK